MNTKFAGLQKIMGVVDDAIENEQGTVCRAFRIALGLSQYDMADLLECSQSSISRAEANHSAYSKILDKEFEFMSKVLAVLDQDDKDAIGAVMGIELAIKPQSKEIGKKYRRNRK